MLKKRWMGLGALCLWAACGSDEPSPRAPTSVPASPDMAAAMPSTPPTPSMPPTMPSAPATAGVSVMDEFYSPKDVTVAVGGTVTWTWRAQELHTVTSDTGVFDSSPPKSSGTFSFTFTSAGTFPYHCLVHGFHMSGTVTVQ